MTFKEIKKELRVKSIREMLDGVGISEQSLSQIKRNNPKRYEIIKIEIILKHFGVGVRDLLELLQDKKMIESQEEEYW